MSGAAARSTARLPPEPASVGAARRFVRRGLLEAGLDPLVGDAQLAVSELVGNAVLHARTEVVLTVSTTPASATVRVEDGSPQPPVPLPLGPTATSGRGLALLQALCTSWGVEPLPGGKAVWFSMESADPRTPVDLSAEELLQMWAGSEPEDPGPRARSVRVVLHDLPVQGVVAAKRRVEDLVRDLRLLLLGEELGAAGAEPAAGLEVARRLDAAVEAFDSGRVQLRTQALAAAARGLEVATLELLLPADALPAVERYRRALDEADELGRRGHLLLAGGLAEHADLRRRYLDEITAQLRAAQQGPPDRVRGTGGVADR